MVPVVLETRELRLGSVQLLGNLHLGLAKFLAELAQRHLQDPLVDSLLKLRFLEFRHGLLPTGQTLEDHFAKRPVIKRVSGQAIHFYPPGYRVHASATGSDRWGCSLHGLRAYAPSLLEAEQEALKILRGLRHLG